MEKEIKAVNELQGEGYHLVDEEDVQSYGQIVKGTIVPKVDPIEEAAKAHVNTMGREVLTAASKGPFTARPFIEQGFIAGWKANPANEEVERLKQIISTLNMRLTGKYEVPIIYTDEDMVKYGIMCYNQGRKDKENHPLAMNFPPLGDYEKSKTK